MAKHNQSKNPSSNKQKKTERSQKLLAKQKRQQAAETQKQNALKASQIGENKLKASRKSVGSNPESLLAAIDSGEIVYDLYAAQRDSLSKMVIAYQKYKKNQSGVFANSIDSSAVKKIFLHCFKYTDLFEPKLVPSYENSLIAVASQKWHWIRSLDDWRPKSHNPRKQFSSLIRHLFAKYDVPLFMDEAWKSTSSSVDLKYQGWFIHIGKGQNIRTASGLPFPLTKKMAHHFLQAPNDFDIKAAFRWAQVINMSGDERMVRALMSTRLNQTLNDDEFVLSIIRWFILHPMLDTVHYGPICDFIYDQKYNRSIPNPDPHGPPMIAPQPNFTMKGRNPETLLQQVTAWHQDLARQSRRHGKTFMRWDHSSIAEYIYEEGEESNKKSYSFEELTTSKELEIEGRAMHHCVSSYAHSCSKGHTSIWSLKKYTTGNMERLLTIEVNPNIRSITQVRGKYNRLATVKEYSILQRWAIKGGPSLSKWVKHA